MSFDYEKLIWGEDTARLSPVHPTTFRLRQGLEAVADLSPQSKVLEVGCGAGQFIRAIKNLRPDLSCYGSDISCTALEKARAQTDGVHYDESDAAKLPYADNFFDGVLVFDVLEHVSDPEKMISEIKRILKPGGKFYAFIPCEGDWLSFWWWLRKFSTFSKLTEKYAGHINRWSRAVWQEKFKQIGLEIFKQKYSEHFFGQLLGVVTFWLMDKKAQRTNDPNMNNEKFFQNQSGRKNIFLRIIKNFVNGLIFSESIILQKLPSPNWHVFLRKK